MNNFERIPGELKALKQWVLWKFIQVEGKKTTKVPYHVDNYKASVTNSRDWSAFDNVIRCYNVGGYDGIGFVFTDTKYSGIDLDDCSVVNGIPNPNRTVDLARQIKIFNEFDSYSERSPSKKGLHIIVKGSVPDGKQLASIELYSTARYFTMTGDVYSNKPIAERQDLLTQLWVQMGGDQNPILSYASNEPQTCSDEDIVDRASKALNSDKFLELYKGDWKLVYPEIAALGKGPSEADQSLMNMIIFYTKNVDQATRIFYSSVLGKREKVQRSDYMNTMIKNAFDKSEMQINLEAYANQIKKQLELPLNGSVVQLVEPAVHNSQVTGSSPVASTTNQSTIPFPPGLVGEIAQFIYDAAPRQVKEIALAAALGLMAGTCGRAYNMNGTGLNLYILVLAKTGRGKEAAASGIDKIMNEVKKSVPTSIRFRGPGVINSGQALIKYIANTSNCFVSVLGEFGLTIDRISDTKANSADKMLYQMLLDLYNKSGYGQTLQSSIYSNKEDSVGITESPTVSILGESTHKLFYDALSESLISQGLLPRFLIIEYNGKREYLNENASKVFPDLMLIEKFSKLVALSETTQHNRQVINVAITNDAATLLRKLDIQSTDYINVSENEVVTELWNRAHMKIMRISSLIAVGIDPINPIVTVDLINWATNLVEHDIKALSSKFENGEIGENRSDEQLQIKEVLKKIKQYFERDWDYVKKYARIQSLHTAKIIPYEYLNKRLSSIGAFNADKKIKPSVPLASCLKLMIDMGILKECPKNVLVNHQTEQKAYILTDMRSLSDV